MISQAQIEPLLNHEWTIEKIVTEEETIMADLDPLGNYDQFIFYNEIELGNMIFYTNGIGGCSGYVYFDSTQQIFYYHRLGCVLSDESSDIAFYFNHTFIDESVEVNLENEFVPVAFGPFSYEFRYENDLVYLDITNTDGDVATFYTTTLSNPSFEKVELSMYPNPASNLVHIQSSNAQILGVEIFNLQGRSILKPEASQLTRVDISPLAKGIYVVKVITTDGELVRKLVKK